MKTASIRRRLLGAIFGTSLTTLLLACLALLTYEFFAYRRTMAGDLQTLASIMAANSGGAVAFQDEEAAKEYLASLSQKTDVVAGCLYDKQGEIFATYGINSRETGFPPAPGPDGLVTSWLQFTIFSPVSQAGGRVGTLFLREDLRAMYYRFGIYALVVLLVMGAAAVVGLLLANFHQRRIAQPIRALAQTARRISEQKDFSVRAQTPEVAEELDALNRAFNEMLEQIHHRDLSLQQAQHELRRHAEQLEGRVAERTQSLEETTRQLYDFCYSVAHDLKAPIRAQAAYARLLMEDFATQLGPEGTDFASRIRDAAERQSRLVSDLLAHVSLSRSDLPIVAVDLAATAQQALGDLHLEVQRRQAQVDLSGLQGRVLANPASLHLILLNLLSNALKFVPPQRGPRVQGWAETREASVRLWIKDNGLGIPAKHLSRLFGMFQRLHTREEYPGTGIGLAIVKRAAERMAGQVGVESEEGQGSCFWVELPAAKGD